MRTIVGLGNLVSTCRSCRVAMRRRFSARSTCSAFRTALIGGEGSLASSVEPCLELALTLMILLDICTVAHQRKNDTDDRMIVYAALTTRQMRKSRLLRAVDPYRGATGSYPLNEDPAPVILA